MYNINNGSKYKPSQTNKLFIYCVFNNNFFYKEWNNIYQSDLIEFILPLENIEIIRSINNLKNNLINLDILTLFEEYRGKNLAFVLIEDNKNLEIARIKRDELFEKYRKDSNLKEEYFTKKRIYDDLYEKHLPEPLKF